MRGYDDSGYFYYWRPDQRRTAYRHYHCVDELLPEQLNAYLPLTGGTCRLTCQSIDRKRSPMNLTGTGKVRFTITAPEHRNTGVNRYLDDFFSTAAASPALVQQRDGVTSV